MSNLSYYALQKAIYEKLVGNSPLMTEVSGIFYYVPQEIEFPFVTIGDMSSSDISNLNKSGVEQQLNINIWSRETGHKQATDIMDMIYGLLHNGSIAVTGNTVVATRFTATSVQMENDGFTYHGIMRLNVLLMNT